MLVLNSNSKNESILVAKDVYITVEQTSKAFFIDSDYNCKYSKNTHGNVSVILKKKRKRESSFSTGNKKADSIRSHM